MAHSDWLWFGVCVGLALCYLSSRWRAHLDISKARSRAEHWREKWQDLRDHVALPPDRDPKTGRYRPHGRHK